ncbi:MAG: cyclic lactone autoinducer peptide [Oscillospiraceae bacterium]|nr:cyclic lactone autoinducer peptide [Oscillospiraceae bacterium]
MKKMKKNVLRKLADVSKFAAVKAAGSTSWGGCHQPKEPEAVRKLRSK